MLAIAGSLVLTRLLITAYENQLKELKNSKCEACCALHAHLAAIYVQTLNQRSKA